MVFTLGVVRGAEFGPQGVQGRLRVALAQQSDQSKLQGVSGEGSAWQGAQLGLCTLLKHCPVQCFFIPLCFQSFFHVKLCVHSVVGQSFWHSEPQ